VLIAGNPTNYAKATKLSTAEALAGALYIAGYKEEAKKLLSVFVWGHTFIELNVPLLDAYVEAKDSAGIIEVMKKKLGGQPPKPTHSAVSKKMTTPTRRNVKILRDVDDAIDFERTDEEQ
jgi:hypothetical protein